jgi:uncharacterized protein YxjI
VIAGPNFEVAPLTTQNMARIHIPFTVFLLFTTLPLLSSAWISPTPAAASFSRSTTRLFNLLDDFGDIMSGGKFVPQTQALPYGEPLGKRFPKELKTFAIQERAISFTGEDFDIFDLDENQPFCKVRGAMLHLPGKDKMCLRTADGTLAATLDRKLVALTPTYDILRGDREKIGWLEKEKIALTDTFSFHLEGGGFGPFKPPPAYKLEGDFLDRRFVMKNQKGQVVAKVTKDQIIEFDGFNHYQVRVAEGMDATLVIACACAIDEEFDEEHKKRKEQEQ